MTWLRFLFYFIAATIKIARPNGAKAVAAENVVLRQQLMVLSRQQKRSPNLTTSDRLIYALLTAWIKPKRLSKIAILIKPATLLKFHKALVKRKYQLLFSNKSPKKSGRKGPSQKLIDLIVEMKTRNPRFGYLRIAMQIQQAFGIEIDKGVVKRVLDKHYKPKAGGEGPSWLTFIGQMKDSLWSVDLFRCESIHLKTHWVMVVMDQFSRRIIGFAVHKGYVNGTALCCMFNKAISKKELPKYLSSDNDPLFTFHQWQANLRILEIEEIKSVPYTPTSHPFIERVIGTVRREYLDHLFFWNARDLQNKLNTFKKYYNELRAHSSLDNETPSKKADEIKNHVISIDNFRWKKHGGNLFQLPIAA